VSETRDYAMRTQVYARIPLRVADGYVRDVLRGDLFPWLRSATRGLPEDVAAGSIIVALAVYSVTFVRARRTWFFVGMLVIALMVGAKAWPFAQMLHAVPLFSRTLNERMATAGALSLSMLAAFAIDRLATTRLALACLALLVLYAAVSIAIPTPLSGLQRLVADLIPLAIAAVIVLVPISRGAVIASLFALLIGQRIVADGALVPVNDPRIAYPRLALFRPLDQVHEPFRIAGTGTALLPNTATMYGLEDVRAHTPITFEPMLETFPLWSTVGAGQFHSIPSLDRPILSMLNLRFAVTNASDAIPPGWHEVSRELRSHLLENERVLPRAFVPRNVRFGTPAQDEVNEMANETDFGYLAWLRADEPPHDRVNGGGTTSIMPHDNGLQIDVSKDGDGFVVISELAWRGWRAYVDGQRVTTLRANHAFLAVFVPNGRHTIDLRYLPESFVVGRAISLLAILIWSASAMPPLWRRRAAARLPQSRSTRP
jgi:Bacterial membrane protein YfhO